MGLHEHARVKIQDCLKEKVLSGELPKDSAINPYRISQVCSGVDPRTARDHLPGIIGLEVEGPNFRGRIVQINESTGPWARVDPPEDDWTGSVPNKESDKNMTWAAAAGLVAGVVILGLVLATHASGRSICTCEQCGAKIDVTGWIEPKFSCPLCGKGYARAIAFS